MLYYLTILTRFSEHSAWHELMPMPVPYLDCYWVGSLGFNFFREITRFSTKPQKVELFAGSTATKLLPGWLPVPPGCRCVSDPIIPKRVAAESDQFCIVAKSSWSLNMNFRYGYLFLAPPPPQYIHIYIYVCLFIYIYM